MLSSGYLFWPSIIFNKRTRTAPPRGTARPLPSILRCQAFEVLKRALIIVTGNVNTLDERNYAVDRDISREGPSIVEISTFIFKLIAGRERPNSALMIMEDRTVR